jgi:hypothetical protein
MKIDPVYLLAPLPKPSTIPTRRAFLLAAGGLVVGAIGGGACGYSMGLAAQPVANASTEPKPAAPVAEEELKTSGDAELDYWRKVALKAPLDELFEKAPMFLHVRGRDYPQDAHLWKGVERLVVEIRDNSSRVVTDELLATLASYIGGRARPAEPSLRDLIPLLRERRQVLRREKR